MVRRLRRPRRLPIPALRRPLSTLIARPDARPALDPWLRQHGTLWSAAAAHPAAEVLQGRGRVYVVPRPEPPTGGKEGGVRGEGGEAAGAGAGGAAAAKWVVRHYHRGGAVASVLGDLYLRVGTPRPAREFAAGRALEAAGVPTPRVVGAAVYPAGLFYRGDLVTEWVPESRDLAAVLFGAGESDRARVAAMRATGRLLRLAHDRRLDHPDLNIKNILIVGEAGRDAMVLDLDRARVGGRPVSDGRRRRMVERFWRSVRKWEAATGEELAPSVRAAFEAGYAE